MKHLGICNKKFAWLQLPGAGFHQHGLQLNQLKQRSQSILRLGSADLNVSQTNDYISQITALIGSRRIRISRAINIRQERLEVCWVLVKAKIVGKEKLAILNGCQEAKQYSPSTSSTTENSSR